MATLPQTQRTESLEEVSSEGTGSGISPQSPYVTLHRADLRGWEPGKRSWPVLLLEIGSSTNCPWSLVLVGLAR